MSSHVLDRPIFVVGHPRSGTTFLASMLGRHPDVASTPESLYLYMVRYQIAPSLRHGPEAVVRAIEESPMRFLVLERDSLVARIAALPEINEANLFEVVLDEFRRVEGASRMLEKTPWHLRHIDEILSWFPDARIVWILRDGRPCVASLMNVPWASDDPVRLARQWVRNMAYASNQMAKHNDSVHLVKYEDLVAAPEVRAAPILDFLDLKPSEEMHDPSREVRTVKPSEAEWKQNITRPAMSSRADAWRHEMDPKVLERIERIMAPQLTHFGYELSSDIPTWRSAAARARAAIVHNPLSLSAMRFAYDRKARLQSRLK